METASDTTMAVKAAPSDPKQSGGPTEAAITKQRGGSLAAKQSRPVANKKPKKQKKTRKLPRASVSKYDPPKQQRGYKYCSECKESIPIKNFNRHVSKHDQKRTTYPCETCYKHFTRRDHMVRHAKIHSDGRHYTCTVCGHTTARKDKLGEHERRSSICSLMKSAEK